MQKTKILTFNILGVLLGFLAGLLCYNLALLLFEWLSQFGFITKIFSYPVEFTDVALTGMFLADIFASAFVCKIICEISKARYNYGIIVIAIISFIRYIYGFISNISVLGFSISLLSVYIFLCIHQEYPY